MPVDPKVLSVMRRSAGMPAAAPALPRFKFIDVITFFKVVLAAIDALWGPSNSGGGEISRFEDLSPELKKLAP